MTFDFDKFANITARVFPDDGAYSLEDALSSGQLTVDEITEKSKRLPVVNDELDEKEMRWLELDELDH